MMSRPAINKRVVRRGSLLAFASAFAFAFVFAPPALADVAFFNPAVDVCEALAPGDDCAFRCGGCVAPPPQETEGLPCFNASDCSPAQQARGDNFGVCDEDLLGTELTDVPPATGEGEGEGDAGEAAACAHGRGAAPRAPPLVVASMIAGLAALVLSRRHRRAGGSG